MTGDGSPLSENCALTSEELAEYQEFFRDYRGKLIWHVRRIIPDHDYQLIADEALRRVWSTWRRPTGSRWAWALSIATNLARDVLRRTRESAEEAVEGSVPLWTTAVDLEAHFEYRETIQYAAEVLTPQEFTAILLQVLGFPMAEAAERLGVRPDSVRRYRSDGRKKLDDWRTRGRPQPHTGFGGDPDRGGAVR